MGIDITSIPKDLRKDQGQRFVKIALLFLFVALTGAILLLSWVPPVSRDALTHHLAVPKLYLEHGGIYEIPSISFSYYPMNLDLLYLIPLYFGNDIVPKFIHFGFALLTAWLIYTYLIKRLGTIWALSGAIFFLSLPIIVKLSITVYVDLGLVFFSTAAIISLFRWMESHFAIKFLLMAAVCCGLALGTKFNGLIVLFLLTALVSIVFLNTCRKSVKADEAICHAKKFSIQSKAVGLSALFCLTALLVFSPWMIRNYIWRGNPIYPLYNSVFNPAKAVSVDVREAENTPDDATQRAVPAQRKYSSKWSSFAIRNVVYHESWWEIALIPVRVFFQGQDDSPKHFDGKLSPFLFLLPFFAFFRIKHNPAALRSEKKILVAFIVLYIFCAFLQIDMRIRYIAPIIPPAVILSIFGLHDIVSVFTDRWKNLSNWSSTVLILLLVCALLTYNGNYIFQQFDYVKPFSYLSGQVSRDEYIAKYRPEYSIYQYANRNLPDNAKILGLYLGNRLYYSDRELIFGINEFNEIINRSDSEKILIKELREKGFTHLIIRFDLFNQWMGKQFKEREKKLLKFFFAEHIRPILSKDGYGLFELRNNQSITGGN